MIVNRVYKNHVYYYTNVLSNDKYNSKIAFVAAGSAIVKYCQA